MTEIALYVAAADPFADAEHSTATIRIGHGQHNTASDHLAQRGCGAHDQAEDWQRRSRLFYDEQAGKLADALISTLPQATVDALLRVLLLNRASLHIHASPDRVRMHPDGVMFAVDTVERQQRSKLLGQAVVHLERLAIVLGEVGVAVVTDDEDEARTEAEAFVRGVRSALPDLEGE